MNMRRPLGPVGYVSLWIVVVLAWQPVCYVLYQMWWHRYAWYEGKCGLNLQCRDSFRFWWFDSGWWWLAAVLVAELAAVWALSARPYTHLLARWLSYALLLEWTAVFLAAYLSARPVGADTDTVTQAYWLASRLDKYAVCSALFATGLCVWLGVKLYEATAAWRSGDSEASAIPAKS